MFNLQYFFCHSFLTPFFLSFAILCISFEFIFIIILLIYKNNTLNNFIFLLFLLSWGFNCLGLTIGILVGNSRESAVNTTISASLTFIGILVGYTFSKDQPSLIISNQIKINVYFSLIILIIFPISMLYGIHLGALNRVVVENIILNDKTDTELKLKLYDSQLKIEEDSVKTFLEIYKDSIKNTLIKIQGKN